MLPDVGLPELLVIAVVALVLGKPEDIPEIMRKMGVFAASVRSWVNGLWLGLEEQGDTVAPVVAAKPADKLAVKKKRKS